MNSVQATKIVQLAQTSKTTGGGTVTATVDMKGYDYGTIVIALSAYTTPTQVALPVVSLLESDDTVVTNFATYIADKGSLASANRDYVYHFDMRARKRYQKISVTNGTAGTDNAMAVGAICIQSKAELEPASTTDMIGTNDLITVI